MRSLASSLLVMGALTIASIDAAELEPSQPNVILVVIDTLRADHLSAYGYGKKTSPRIEALAADGVLYEQSISASSWTLPAHAAHSTASSQEPSH